MKALALLVPVLFSLALTLPGIGRKGFLHEDEWRNAVMVREMAATGPVLHPRLHGALYPDYPPLYFWCALPIAKLQGSVTPFAVRFPATIGAALMAFGTALLALRLASVRTALVAGVLVSVIPALHYEARRAMIDPLFAGLACVSVALLAQATLRSFAAGCAFLALAWLTKGPLGAVVIGLALAGGEGLLFARDPSGPAWKWLQVRAVVFVLVVLAIGFVWFGLAYALYGRDFGNNLLYTQTIGRFLQIEQHAKPPWFYLVTTVPALLPVLAFCASIRRTRLSMFALGWFVLVFAFFSISKTKRSYYLMPAYPAVALVAAQFFEIPFGERFEKIWTRSLEGVLLVGVIGGGVFGLVKSDFAGFVWPLGLACLLGFVAFAGLAAKGRPALGFAAAVGFVLAVISATIVPSLTSRHGHEELAAKLKGYEHVAVSPGGAHREALCWFFARSAVDGMPNIGGETPGDRIAAINDWLERFPRGTACVLLHDKDWDTLPMSLRIGTHAVAQGDDDPGDVLVAVGN